MEHPHVKTFKIFLQNIGKSFYTCKQYSLEAQDFYDFCNENCEDYFHINKKISLFLQSLQKNNYSLATINKRKASLRSFLLFLYDRRIIEAFDDNLLQPEKITKDINNYIEPSLLNEIIDFCHQCYELASDEENRWLASRNLLMVLIISQLGLKPSEIVKMRWHHINEEESTILILGNKKHRTIPIKQELLDSFRYFKRDTLKTMPEQEGNPFIWLGLGNVEGEPITVKTVERVFLFISEKTDIKITATALRYFSFNRFKEKDIEQHSALGYSRKDIYFERYKLLYKTKTQESASNLH